MYFKIFSVQPPLQITQGFFKYRSVFHSKNAIKLAVQISCDVQNTQTDRRQHKCILQAVIKYFNCSRILRAFKAVY
jgi:hypothetical protein